MEFIYLIIGFLLLIKASDYFVNASVKIAKIFHISEVIIGATIVALGTTLPETMVSATSAYMGHGDISFGNAIGSIICNTALISGIALLFSPSKINRKALTIPTIFFFATFILYALNAYIFKSFSRVSGIILLLIFIYYAYKIIKEHEENDKKVDLIKYSKAEIIMQFGILFASAFVVAFGSKLLVDNGIVIARKYGIPEAVIGLTIIAFGTSLPEFSTAITSLVKGHNSLSIGNIIGANLFNLLNVTGIAAVIRPFDIPNDRMIFGINTTLLIDFPIALIAMLVFIIPTIIKQKTYRLQGLLMLLIYIAYIAFQYVV